MKDYTSYTYQFNDTLSTGLSFNADSVKVYYATGDSMLAVNSSTSTGAGGTLIDATNYTKVATSDGFTLKFANLKSISGIAAGGYIVVEYNATLTTAAVVGNPGNPNEVTLTYSNNPNNVGSGTPTTNTTPKDEVVVFTFELPVNKVIKGTTTPLSSATFALFTDKTAADAAAAATNPDLSAALKFDSSAAGSYTYDAAKGTVTTLADNNGAYSIKGLDQGTYYLVEISAPAGYNKLTTAQAVKIIPTYTATAYKDGHVVDATNDQLSAVNISLNGGTAAQAAVIENASGSTLPSTGGIGTKIFTYGGIALMVAAAVVFVTKRKVSREEK
jgi:fimbrial isopeptide formation D2 family protein/LPXTG-motif cell wall-anchored protein